ncbi:MAG: type II toxin-antitoxin system VapC family toxin [Burkholderiaceae bacterium]
MIAYLLDTNIFSYALKPHYPALTARFEQALLGSEIAISAVMRAEIRAGQRRLNANDKRQAMIDKAVLSVPTLDWTSQAAEIYGEIHFQLRSTGQVIGILDTQIAAHALAENLILVTHNIRHFSRVPGLRLEDWTV